MLTVHTTHRATPSAQVSTIGKALGSVLVSCRIPAVLELTSLQTRDDKIKFSVGQWILIVIRALKERYTEYEVGDLG